MRLYLDDRSASFSSPHFSLFFDSFRLFFGQSSYHLSRIDVSFTLLSLSLFSNEEWQCYHNFICTFYFYLFVTFNCYPLSFFCPVSRGCRIHWLHLCRGVRPSLMSVPDMTLNNLMVRFQQCSSFGECRVPLHCHRSQVHSGPEW